MCVHTLPVSEPERLLKVQEESRPNGVAMEDSLPDGDTKEESWPDGDTKEESGADEDNKEPLGTPAGWGPATGGP